MTYIDYLMLNKPLNTDTVLSISDYGANNSTYNYNKSSKKSSKKTSSKKTSSIDNISYIDNILTNDTKKKNNHLVSITDILAKKKDTEKFIHI